MIHFIGFGICALIIFFAGKRLSHYGDLLAVKTGLSKGWIGLILMATVTSLPEMMVGISSSAFVGSADLAVGDVIGSCAFNLGILALLDAFIPQRKPLLGIASPTHLLNAGLGTILIAMVGITLYIPHHVAITPWIGLSSVLFIIVYFVSIRMIYINEKNNTSKSELKSNASENEEALSLRKIITRYTFFAMIIVGAALALPFFAEEIAKYTGLERSFVGTFFLAISTSLPEIAVSIYAVRMGAIDLAVGNLLGSNIFNILVLSLDDIFYTKGLLLEDATDNNLISILSTIMMSSVVIIGLSIHAKGKKFLLAWDAIVIAIIYLINLFLLIKS